MMILTNKTYPMCENDHTITIPLEVLKANFDRRGYFARHRHHYRAFRGQRGAGRLAWEALEAELAGYCLPGRYSSFESFKEHRRNWIKSLRRN